MEQIITAIISGLCVAVPSIITTVSANKRSNNLDDLQDKVFRPVGSVFECNEERAKYLLNNNAIIIVDTKAESENIKPLNGEKLEKLSKEMEKYIQIKPKKKKSSKK